MEETAEAKTAKNRAKRQKKKERSKGKNEESEITKDGRQRLNADLPIKKRRLVNETELVFRKPVEGSDDDESQSERGRSEIRDDVSLPNPSGIQDAGSSAIAEVSQITFVEEDYYLSLIHPI